MYYFLALFVFYLPFEIDISEEQFYLLKPHLQQIALDLEIVDERETFPSIYEHYKSDMETMKIRHKELADCPSIVDRYRFLQSREFITEQLEFNGTYGDYLENNQLFYSRYSQQYWDYQTIIDENKYLYRVWDAIRDLQNDYYLPTQRTALKTIKELIGEENYYRGTLPPCVPIWRFRLVE